MIKDGKVERLDFIVAGAQKCGTTALHYQLEKASADRVAE